MFFWKVGGRDRDVGSMAGRQPGASEGPKQFPSQKRHLPDLPPHCDSAGDRQLGSANRRYWEGEGLGGHRLAPLPPTFTLAEPGKAKIQLNKGSR